MALDHSPEFCLSFIYIGINWQLARSLVIPLGEKSLALEYHQMMLHNTYQGSKPSGFTEEDEKRVIPGIGPFLATELLFEQIRKSTSRLKIVLCFL